MAKYRKANSSSTIRDIQKLISEHLYDEDLEEEDPFFFNVKLDSEGFPIIGNGSDNEHLHIQITSKKLMSNIERKSVHHMVLVIRLVIFIL